MKTLYLMRHADTLPAAANQDDHERRLSPLGLQQAWNVSQYIGSKKHFPGAILSSDAMRTMMTAEIVADGRFHGHIHSCPALYHAVLDTFFEEIAKVDDAHDCLLIVAHNPGIAEFAMHLAYNDPQVSAFPPSTLVRFVSRATSWVELSPKNCVLENVFRA